MKTLKTKKYYIDRCYYSLNATRPSEFATFAEIESAGDILETLEDEAKDHYIFIKKAEEVNRKYHGVKPKDKRFQKQQEEINELNKQLSNKEYQDRSKLVTVNFEKDDFNQFFQFFQRWGKNWFFTIQEFSEFKKNMNEANSKADK